MSAIKPFRVMKGEQADMNILTFPKLGSKKLDGIRCHIRGGVGYSTANIPLPNLFLQSWIQEFQSTLEGLDGELIVGPPNAAEVYNRTNSGIMSEGGEPDFTFYVFDWVRVEVPETANFSYMVRSHEAISKVGILANYTDRICWLDQTLLQNMGQLDEFEADTIIQGYEGIMLRDPMATYKFGKSTAKQQGLLKVKRWRDAEARIVGWKPKFHNANEATIDERGLTKRSSHKAGKVALEKLGAWRVVGVTAFEGLEFDVSGFTDEEAIRLWGIRQECINRLIRFKYFPVGIKELPRFPGWMGFRDRRDMDDPRAHKPAAQGSLL